MRRAGPAWYARHQCQGSCAAVAAGPRRPRRDDDRYGTWTLVVPVLALLGSRRIVPPLSRGEMWAAAPGPARPERTLRTGEGRKALLRTRVAPNRGPSHAPRTAGVLYSRAPIGVLSQRPTTACGPAPDVYSAAARLTLPRRDGRVAEGARLESVFAGNRNVGSNPTPSASSR